MKPGTTVKVRGYSGIAWYVASYPEIWDGDDIDGEWIKDTGSDMRLCVMVGDDRKYTFHVDDMTPIGDDEYCSGCGQLGHGECGVWT